MRHLKENTRIGLAFATGLLSWLSFPTVGLWPLSFVAWVPLFVALDGVRPSGRGLALGWLAGVTMTSLGFSFLVSTLTRFSGFSVPTSLLLFTALGAYQGLRAGALGLLVVRGASRGWPRSLVLLFAFITSELVVPLPFPWTFGAAVHHVVVLAQVADLGGPIAVSVVVMAVNVGAFELLRGALRLGTSSPRVALAAFSLPALALVYGVYRIDRVEHAIAEADVVRVGIVQANLTAATRDIGVDRQVAETRKLAAAGADLVVWSEASIPGPFPERDLDGALEASVTGRLGVASVVGLTVRRREVGHPPRVFNSAVIASATGSVLGRYDKQHLLPFGEYLPFGERWPVLRTLSPASGDFSPGSEREGLSFRGHRMTATICYEDILPTYVSDLVRSEDPELLVNLTNDGWFTGSSEPRTHLALARLRAIEHRLFLVRATNSSVSALIDPLGRVAISLPPDVETSALGDAKWMHMHTVYDSIGDAPWYVCAAASIAMALVRSSRKRQAGAGQKKPASSERPPSERPATFRP